MRYSSHRSETAILSTKCRRRMAAFSSDAYVRRARFLLIRDPFLLHRVEPEGVTFQLNRNSSPPRNSSVWPDLTRSVRRPGDEFLLRSHPAAHLSSKSSKRCISI